MPRAFALTVKDEQGTGHKDFDRGHNTRINNGAVWLFRSRSAGIYGVSGMSSPQTTHSSVRVLNTQWRHSFQIPLAHINEPISWREWLSSFGYEKSRSSVCEIGMVYIGFSIVLGMCLQTNCLIEITYLFLFHPKHPCSLIRLRSWIIHLNYSNKIKSTIYILENFIRISSMPCFINNLFAEHFS